MSDRRQAPVRDATDTAFERTDTPCEKTLISCLHYFFLSYSSKGKNFATRNVVANRSDSTIAQDDKQKWPATDDMCFAQ